MSLRTKILAAVVGLNLLVLVLGISVLLFVLPPTPGVPRDVVALATGVSVDPGKGVTAKNDARLKQLLRLQESPGVRAAVWLEELGEQQDPGRNWAVVGSPAIVAVASKEDVKRGAALLKEAMQVGQARVLESEMALVLDGGPAASLDPPDSRRQGLYVRWSPGAADVSRAKSLYFVLLGGIVVVTFVAWRLLSLLVVKPLAALADAADRMAGGDGEARVATSGAGDEFDRTAAAFNRMAKEVSEYQGQLEDRVLQALSRIQKAEQHLAIAQRLAATGKLASGIAHEINNPLGGMKNAARALARGDLDPAKTAEYLDLIQDGLSRVEDTVKKVLTFTPRAVEPRPTDLSEVARKAVALARHRIDRKGIVLEERIPAAGVVTVFGDPHELQQVALNLLLNAADAIPDAEEARAEGPRALGAKESGGKPHGRIEFEIGLEGDSALLRVSDDGIGMTPEVLAQCFDLFFTTKEVGEGTGLGLAVVHNIVTNHGGRIDVESAPGRGTTFRVHLPREGGTAPQPRSAEIAEGDRAVTRP